MNFMTVGSGLGAVGRQITSDRPESSMGTVGADKVVTILNASVIPRAISERLDHFSIELTICYAVR
jgi:hypothetical protein